MSWEPLSQDGFNLLPGFVVRLFARCDCPKVHWDKCADRFVCGACRMRAGSNPHGYPIRMVYATVGEAPLVEVAIETAPSEEAVEAIVRRQRQSVPR